MNNIIFRFPSGLAVLVGEAGACSLASKTHRKSFLIV